MIDTFLCQACGSPIWLNVVHACTGALPSTVATGTVTVTIEAPAAVHEVLIVLVPNQLSGDRLAHCSCGKMSKVTDLSLAEHWAREHLAPYGWHDRPAPATSR